VHILSPAKFHNHIGSNVLLARVQASGVTLLFASFDEVAQQIFDQFGLSAGLDTLDRVFELLVSFGELQTLGKLLIAALQERCQSAHLLEIVSLQLIGQLNLIEILVVYDGVA